MPSSNGAAESFGRLYLYVNEAVFPLHMDYWYRNNKGSAMVTITQRDR